MSCRLLIEKGVFTSRAALLKDDILDRFLLENNARPSLVGEIRLGRVAAHLNGIDAAIISLGDGLDGFLRAQDWPGPKSDTPFSQKLTEGSLLPVQVTKDPIDDKPYQVTGYVTLENEYVILKPKSDRIQFAKAFKDPAQKAAIETMLTSHTAGLTLRSKAATLTPEDLLPHIQKLEAEWQKIEDLSGAMQKAGVLRTSASFKDRVSKKWGARAEEIVIAPPAASPLFASEGIDHEVKDLTETRIDLTGGGFLTIEPTEALVAIDVNSAGSDTWAAKGAPQQQVNEVAAVEISRQLRLRNLSGMILIDVAGIQSKTEAGSLVEILRRETKSDDAHVEILGPSQLGLMQLTRQRTSAPLHHILKSPVAGPDTPSLQRLMDLEDSILDAVSHWKTRLVKLNTGARLGRYLKEANALTVIYECHQIQLDLTVVDSMTKDQFQIDL
ncbi:hypothetical protein GUA87_00255 [Sneathiella sp. P13V-1]|uniref:ribonuclease E/G n=1 Tax=Sneathiella sp. P13V-1 TaxID=2697366 RepID=UPI00187B4893|nr:ribonuclease E/G [Sneathiella sp. P13V-1]MBE7635259.1 hypothetical protein [Sneathiella sp. P13V-1]